MSDVTYSVEVQFLQNGNFNAPASGLNQMNVKLSQTQAKAKDMFAGLGGGISGFASAFGSVIDGIGGAMLNLGMGAASALSAGLAAGLAVGVKEAFHFNEELENTKISLAAIASSNGLVQSMGQGLTEAGMVLSRMQQDAAKLPGEFKDLEGILATLASPGALLGHDMFEMERYSANVMAAAAILKVPMAVAGREMALILEGAASHRMPFFNRLGVGMDAKAWNKLTPDKRWEMSEQALERLVKDAKELHANSWAGIKSTAADNLRKGVAYIGAPLFESVKWATNKFNTWAINANTKNRAIGDKLGEYIQVAFHKGLYAIEHWATPVKNFATTMYNGVVGVWEQASPLIHGILTRVENFMNNPKAFEHIASLAKLMVALKGGTMALGVGGNILKAGSGLAPMLGAASGETAAAALTALGPAALIGAAAAVALGVGIYGAIGAMEDSTSAFHESAMFYAGDITKQASQVGNAWTRFLEAIKPVTDLLGTVFLMVVDGAVTTVRVMIEAFAAAAEGIGKIAKILESWAIKWGYLDSPLLTPGAAKEKLHPEFFHPEHIRDADKRKIPNNVTHVHHVEIKVNSNQDPNRIAKRTVDLIGELARHPKVAAATGNPVFST